MVQNFLSFLAHINHTNVQCVGDNEILVYHENRFYLQHFQMLVYLYFDSNKKYNAVVKIQKEKNQTGPIPKISYCKLQKITNPQIIKIKLPQKEGLKWYMYLTTLHLYLVCVLSFSVPVVVFVSAALKDF